MLRLLLLDVMQSGFHPDPTGSFQFSCDGSLSAVQFAGNFFVRGSLNLKQHDPPHRFFRKRREQLSTILRDVCQYIGRLMVALNLVDPTGTKFSEPRFPAYKRVQAGQSGPKRLRLLYLNVQ